MLAIEKLTVTSRLKGKNVEPYQPDESERLLGWVASLRWTSQTGSKYLHCMEVGMLWKNGALNLGDRNRVVSRKTMGKREKSREYEIKNVS